MRQPRSLVFMVTSEMTAATFLKGYLASLRAHGFDVTLVASSEGGLERLAAAEGVSVEPVPMRREPSPGTDVVSLLRTVRLFRRLRPEIVVTATPKASLLGMLAAAMTRVPVRVYQVWGLRIETERGLRRLVLEALERLTLRLASHITANSTSLAAEVRRYALGRRVDMVGHGSSHGVDLERFNRSAEMPALPGGLPEALAKDRLIVGSVGRVHRDKGILTLLQAMHAVAAERPATLLVVGPDEDAATEARLAEDHGPLRVIRVGAVDDPRPWFLAMDIHVLPTLREGFPNVVLEAAALGVPTITTDATGARDSVIDGVTGRIVPAGDPESLAIAIASLASDPLERERFAIAGRAHVERHFEQQAVWDAQGSFLEGIRAATIARPERASRRRDVQPDDTSRAHR